MKEEISSCERQKSFITICAADEGGGMEIKMIYQIKPINDITIWGGTTLNEIRGLKDTKGGTSWEISFHPYGINEVIGLDINLKELLEKDSKSLIGDTWYF